MNIVVLKKRFIIVICEEYVVKVLCLVLVDRMSRIVFRMWL